MTLMLVALFASVVVGLSAKNFGRRQTNLCVLIAVALTLVYYLRPAQMS